MALNKVYTKLLSCSSFNFPTLGRSPWSWQGSLRTLYTKEGLGVDGYERARNKTQTQFAGMDEKFKEKMKEFAFADSNNMIFTEDLKNVVHLAEDKEADFTLVHQMLKKFNQQNKHLRFGNFIFGPVVMRMYHYLNEPAQALAAFKDEELEGMFDQMVTFQILGDLLYNNEKYEDVLSVLEIAKNKQIQGFKYPRNLTVLALASCWKLNNIQSYEYALKILNDLKEIGAETNRRGITFAASLAIKQNAPNVALEILTLAKKANYYTVKNLKVAALADLGRPDDAFPILRHGIENEDPNPTGERKPAVCKDVLEKLSAAVDRLGNKEVTLEFEKIRKAMSEVQLISDDTVDAALESEIEYFPNKSGPNQRFQRETVGKSFKIGQSISLNPRRNPVYNRERQSIKHEY